jgi:adenine-specific DNA-methyltransferase
MEGMSLDVSRDIIQKLQEIIPGAFTDGKISFEKLERLLGNTITTGAERYQLSWPGKSEAYRLLQTPTTATLLPEPARSINWEEAQHVFIEGENLETLKVLQRSYYGKVRMIYIDPPYNTGSDSFVYPDRFAETKEEYLKKLGEKDNEGFLIKEVLFKPNKKENGQFHSNWLSMMLPRLFLARNLLQEEGYIFVSIDDNELSSLKLLMDEVFGEENFRNILLVRRYDKNINTQFLDEGLKSFNTGAEYVLIYSKSPASRMNPVFREASEERKSQGYWKGFWNDAERKTMQYNLLGVNITGGQWKWKEEVAKEAVKNYDEYLETFSAKMSLEDYWRSAGANKKFIRRKPGGKGMNKGVEHWIAPNDKILRNTLWQDVFASKVPQGFDVPFNNPKNPELIKLLMEIAIGDSGEGIVMDFFGGSGTTAHAVLDHNAEKGARLQFITVQMPEAITQTDEAYAKGHRFISDITCKRIKDVMENYSAKQKKRSDAKPVGFKAFKLSPSNFKIWRGDMARSEKDLIAQTKLFRRPVKANAGNLALLWELLIKNGFPLTVEIAPHTVDGSCYYTVAGDQLAVVLEKYSEAVQESLIGLKSKSVICLDALFNGDDCLKTNAIMKLEQEGSEFHSI